MMPRLTTEVMGERLPRVEIDTRVVSMGSCFADEIGARMKSSGIEVEQNPFGTLYNPASIADNLMRLMERRSIGEESLIEHDGLWHSWLHHGAFSGREKEEVLRRCNERMEEASDRLQRADVLMVTFGTAYVYRLRGGMVVANCHKLPQAMFERVRMSVDEVVETWSATLERLWTFNKDIEVVMTVSPIRHLSDGAHGNQLSKATLLLATERLCQMERMHYFPAYEIVLDELRDYRYYGADMAHPTQTAVDVVWHRFQQCAMSPAMQQTAHNNAKYNKQSNHKPIYQQ